jgi:hypothetical protein
MLVVPTKTTRFRLFEDVAQAIEATFPDLGPRFVSNGKLITSLEMTQ